MINYELNYENNYIVNGVISTDITIDLLSDYFDIEIKDLLENYIQRTRYNEYIDALDNDFKPSLSVGKNVFDYNTETYSNNIYTYCNQDKYSFIKNGFQFWIDNTKHKLFFRIASKSTPVLNNEAHNQVGFYAPTVIVRLDESNSISFNIIFYPNLKTSSIYKDTNDTLDIQVPSNNNRIEFNYCSAIKNNNKIFLNESSSAFSSVYTLSSKSDYDLNHISNTTGIYGNKPLYKINNSAYIPYNLVFEEIEDITKTGTSSVRDVKLLNINTIIGNKDNKSLINCVPGGYLNDEQFNTYSAEYQTYYHNSTAETAKADDKKNAEEYLKYHFPISNMCHITPSISSELKTYSGTKSSSYDFSSNCTAITDGSCSAGKITYLTETIYQQNESTYLSAGLFCYEFIQTLSSNNSALIKDTVSFSFEV